MIVRYLLSLFRLVVIFLFFIFFTRTFIVQPGRINGVSMETTFLDNQLFFVNKLSLLFSPPYRGEIIQARDPQLGTLVVKRVIGLPGEQVSIRENTVFITDLYGNTFPLYEPYLKQGSITQSENRQATDYPRLEHDEYFVLGDNRRESHDSREYGPVPRDLILGTVITRF